MDSVEGKPLGQMAGPLLGGSQPSWRSRNSFGNKKRNKKRMRSIWEENRLRSTQLGRRSGCCQPLVKNRAPNVQGQRASPKRSQKLFLSKVLAGVRLGCLGRNSVGYKKFDHGWHTKLLRGALSGIPISDNHQTRSPITCKRGRYLSKDVILDAHQPWASAGRTHHLPVSEFIERRLPSGSICRLGYSEGQPELASGKGGRASACQVLPLSGVKSI